MLALKCSEESHESYSRYSNALDHNRSVELGPSRLFQYGSRSYDFWQYNDAKRHDDDVHWSPLGLRFDRLGWSIRYLRLFDEMLWLRKQLWLWR